MFGLSHLHLALAILGLPLLSAAIIALAISRLPAEGAGGGGRGVALVSVGTALATLVASLALLSAQLGSPAPLGTTTAVWLPSAGAAMATVGFRLDGISIPMLVVVTSVASAVQVFSLGYMASEPPKAFARYFAYHSLFIFSMALLVVAPNLLQLFAGWELVGLTSYLLIGFYYQKPTASRAAVKAFWTTKFADMGLLVGVIVLYAVTGGFGWDAKLGEAEATAVTLLLFLAVMGKSAQFPLHVWLPDAMEGPTPVSALLHAATMVAAGVYLLVRANPLFAQAPLTLDVMAYVGATTALFAALVAVVQTDIKRVLAYSTCSQLGYMVAAIGAGSVMGGYFHLTTHAFFKALLFLAAGSVIHGVHSNELGDMGGLFSKMKVTAVVFIIGALALAGVPGLAGFFSKDLILEAMAGRGHVVPLVMLVAAAALTAFYMGRVVFLAFFGPPSKKAEKAHESGPSMLGPLVALAALAVGVGYFGGAFAGLAGQAYEFHVGAVGVVATVLALGGIALAFSIYGRRRAGAGEPAFLSPLAGVVRSAVIDRAYEVAFRRVLLTLSDIIGYIDRYVIDGLMNLSGYAAIRAGQVLRRTQTGNVQDYVWAVVASAVLVVAWGFLR